MNYRSLRLLLDFTAMVMLTISCVSAVDHAGIRSDFSPVQFSSVAVVRVTHPVHDQRAMDRSVGIAPRPASRRGHCPSGCHAGVTGDHVRLY